MTIFNFRVQQRDVSNRLPEYLRIRSIVINSRSFQVSS